MAEFAVPGDVVVMHVPSANLLWAIARDRFVQVPAGRPMMVVAARDGIATVVVDPRMGTCSITRLRRPGVDGGPGPGRCRT